MTVYSSVKDVPAVTVYQIVHTPSLDMKTSTISATPCFHIRPPGEFTTMFESCISLFKKRLLDSNLVNF